MTESVQSSVGDRPIAGILVLVFGLFAFSIQDIVIKAFADRYSVLQIVFVRATVAVPLMLVMVLVTQGRGGLYGRRVGLMLLKGLLAFCSYMTYYLAIAALPLAQAVAIVFTAPIFVTVLSALVLRQEVGMRRWTAVAVGFASVLVIVGVGDELNLLGAALALVAALTYALSTLLTVYVAPYNQGWTISLYTMFSFLVGSVILSTVFSLFSLESLSHPSLEFLFREWRWPDKVDLVLMAALGVIASFGFYAITRAYTLGPASAVAPFEYTYMLWAILFGVLVFDEYPRATTLLGAGILVTSSLYIFFREQTIHRQNASGS